MLDIEELDPSIINTVIKLNTNGFITNFSCSGTVMDHLGDEEVDLKEAYISFPLKYLSQKQLRAIIKAAKETSGLNAEITDKTLEPVVKVAYTVKCKCDGNIHDIHEEVTKRVNVLRNDGVQVMEMRDDGFFRIKKSIYAEVIKDHRGILIVTDEVKVAAFENFARLLCGAG